MANINSSQPPVGPQPIEPIQQITPTGHLAEVNGISDVVEISNVARLAAMAHELPEVRMDLVQRVKAEIAAGTYETPERMDVALSKLMEELHTDV